MNEISFKNRAEFEAAMRVQREHVQKLARLQGFDHGYREGRSQGRWEGAYMGLALAFVIVLAVIGFSR